MTTIEHKTLLQCYLRWTVLLVIIWGVLILLVGTIGQQNPSSRIGYATSVNGDPIITFVELRPYREMTHATGSLAKSLAWSTDGRYLYYIDYLIEENLDALETSDPFVNQYAIVRYDTLLDVDYILLETDEPLEFPMPSPDEKHIIYLENSDLWIHDLISDERILLVAPFVLNEPNRDVLWSPNADAIFYIYENRLWCYHLTTKVTSLLAENLTTINRLQWSLDQSELAFVVSDNQQQFLKAYHLETGQLRTLFILDSIPVDYALSSDWSDIQIINTRKPDAPILARWQPYR